MIVNFKKEIEKDNSIFIDQDNVIPKFKKMNMDQRKDVCMNDRFPFDVCLLNVTGNLNVGVIARSSHLLGADNVFIVGRKKYDKRSTVGVENYTNIHIIEALEEETLTIDVDKVLTLLQSNPLYLPVFCETDGTSIGSFSWKEKLYNTEKEYLKPILIFGNEGRGIDKGILDLRDTILSKHMTVSIPQRGVINSFNVSSAAAIIMWDLVNSMNWMKS